MRKLLGLALLAVAVILTNRAWAEDKPKNDISAVMDMAHKGKENSLRSKVASNKAEKADAEKLLALYEDLAQNKPPKGDEASWKTKTGALVAAAKKLVADPKSKAAGTELNKASNCMACHDVHKGDE